MLFLKIPSFYILEIILISGNRLPPLIMHLKFGYSFYKGVDMLSPLRICLIFGHKFNQSVDKLPPSMWYFGFMNKCILKILYVSDIIHVIHKNYADMRYVLIKNKCVKN